MKAVNVIDLVAPSSSSGLIFEEVKKATKYYIDNNFKINLPDDLIDPSLIYHAHNDEYRSKHFEKVAFNDSSSIIWCVRGGYGAAKVIEHLQKLPIPKHKKTLIGFSDITALHLFASQKWGWRCIHGAGFYRSRNDAESQQNIDLVIDLLKGHSKTLILPELKLIANPPSAAIEAVATGGNLSLIQTSIGTSWQLEAKGKILLLEDCNERGYKVDRMLFHLYQAGLLKEVKAIIYGDIVGGDEKDGQNHVQYALKEIAKIIKIPLFQTQYFGHGIHNHPFLIDGRGVIRPDGQNFVFEQKVG